MRTEVCHPRSHGRSRFVTVENEVGQKPLASFLLIAFGGSLALSLFVALTGGGSSAFVGKLGPLAMLLPALGVLCVRVVFQARVPDAGWRRFPIRWLPVALFVLPAAIHAVALCGTVLFEGRLPWVGWLAPASDGLFHTPVDRGWGALTSSGLAIRLAMNALLGLVVVSVFAFFEEIGWRAWLLPRLVGRFGARNGAIASAVIWAAWHVPYALSGIQRIENVAPATLAMLAPLGQVGAGLFLA